MAADAISIGAAAFEADPDPRFIYPHPGLQRVCAELLAFELSERPGCLLITGAAGTGKSILLRSIPEERRLGEDCHLLSCAGGLSFEALVKAWCAALRIAPRAKAHKTRLAALNTHLAARNKQAGAAALLLDDAELLDQQALEELCALTGAGTVDRRLVRIVLAMRPEPAARLADLELAALRPLIAFQACLEAMNEAEVEAYIRHRLAVAGCETPDQLFSGPAGEIIARASLGVPRLINVICRTALAVAKTGGLAKVSAEQIEVAIQACMLHAQDSLAAQHVLPLPKISAAGAETAPAAIVARPAGPPRPEASWPMVVDFDAAADEASGSAPAQRWPRRWLRAAPGLLAGLLCGLAVATLFPAQLQLPDAMPPGLLLSAEDEKARLIGAGPAVTISEPPVETRAPGAEPAALGVEPWIGAPAIAPEPVVLSPDPSLPSQPLRVEPAFEASEPLEEEPGPEADPAVPDRETSAGAPEIEAEPAPEPPVEARAPEAAPAALDREPWIEAPEAEPAVPASQRPLETRTSDTVPVVPSPDEPADSRAPEAQPAVPIPKPPVKPRLFLGRDTSAAAVPATELPEVEAEADAAPTSWIGNLVDVFSSAEQAREARRFDRNPDR